MNKKNEAKKSNFQSELLKVKSGLRGGAIGGGPTVSPFGPINPIGPIGRPIGHLPLSW